MYAVTLEGQDRNVTYGQGHVVTRVGHVACVDAYDRRHKHIETTFMSVALVNQKFV